MNPRLYVTLATFAQHESTPLDLLKASGLAFDVNPSGQRLNKEGVIAALSDYDGVVAGLEPYDVDVLMALPRLKCISRCGVGVDNIDACAAKARNITVLNTPDVVVQPVVELALALILNLLRQTTALTLLMRQRRWEKITGLQLAGQKVGVVGLGRIGRRMAELLTRLDAQVLAYDLNMDEAWAKTTGVRLTDYHDLLRHSDIVTLHVAPTAARPFCLGAEDFARMKKGAFLINVSRGSLVDEPALVNALGCGHLAGAGLDVYAQEPYTGPLCDLPNVVLTPHVATLTMQARGAMETEAVGNLLKFFGKAI